MGKVILPKFGIEEEFQIINTETYELAPVISEILSDISHKLKRGYPSFSSDVHKCILECRTDKCSYINDLKNELFKMNNYAMNITKGKYCLCGGGTHLFSNPAKQQLVSNPRYDRLKIERGKHWLNAVVFGLHIHVGIENETILFQTINKFRYLIPTFISLTANSPFWNGKKSGYASSRLYYYTKIYSAGIPPIIYGWNEFSNWIENNRNKGIIEEKDVYWDIRPRKDFNTLEIRFIDMPFSITEILIISSLILATISLLIKNNSLFDRFYCNDNELIENRKIAIKDGMKGIYKVNDLFVTANEQIKFLLDIIATYQFEDKDLHNYLGILKESRTIYPCMNSYKSKMKKDEFKVIIDRYINMLAM